MKIVGFYIFTTLVYGEAVVALDNNVMVVTENIHDVDGFLLLEKNSGVEESPLSTFNANDGKSSMKSYGQDKDDSNPLQHCEDVEKAVSDLFDALKDIDHITDVKEVYNKGQAVVDALNPSKWAPEYQTDFHEFFNLKKQHLYSVKGLDFLCDRFIRRELAGGFDKILRCLAKWSNGTIVLAASGSLTINGSSQSMGFNVAYGEDGQTSCSYIEEGALLNQKHGFDLALYGAEMSYAVSWLPSIWGGFGNIGSNHHGEGKVWTFSISFGSIPDLDLFAVCDFNKKEYKIIKIVEKVKELLDRDFKNELKKIKEQGPREGSIALFAWIQSILVTALELVQMGTGIVGFGAGFSVGLEFIDLSDILAVEIPGISALHGSELLITCDGKGCAKKNEDFFKEVKGLDDSTPCKMPFECLRCKNTAYPWFGDQFTLDPRQLRCGRQPCWGDKTACNTAAVNPCDPEKALNLNSFLYHNPGKTCCNKESFWYGRDYLPITAPKGTGNRCGKQPCFKDETVVGGPIMPYKVCCNQAQTWYGKLYTPPGTKRCGRQSCFGDGTLVGGPTMPYNVCCRNAETWYGSKATLPGTKRCGRQPCFGDGTLVGGPAMPYNVCCRKAETWYGSKATLPGTKRCGRQPCFGDGTLVGGPTMPYKVCCNTANTWYGSKYTPPGIKRCGTQRCFGKGTVCAEPTTPCSRCCKYSRKWYQVNIDCD